jgi:hypothetical protein
VFIGHTGRMHDGSSRESEPDASGNSAANHFLAERVLVGEKAQSGLLPSTLLSGQTSSSVWGAEPFGETVPPHDLALRHSPGQLRYKLIHKAPFRHASKPRMLAAVTHK